MAFTRLKYSARYDFFVKLEMVLNKNFRWYSNSFQQRSYKLKSDFAVDVVREATSPRLNPVRSATFCAIILTYALSFLSPLCGTGVSHGQSVSRIMSSGDIFGRTSAIPAFL